MKGQIFNLKVFKERKTFQHIQGGYRSFAAKGNLLVCKTLPSLPTIGGNMVINFIVLFCCVHSYGRVTPYRISMVVNHWVAGLVTG